MKTTAGSIIGTGAPARLPPFSQQVDWEAELGVVIARPTRNVPEERALDGSLDISSSMIFPPET